MAPVPTIVKRYLEDGTIIRLGLSHLSPAAKLAGAAVVIFSGADRQSLVDRAARVLAIPWAAIEQGLEELEQAQVIRPRDQGNRAAGYEVCSEHDWRVR